VREALLEGGLVVLVGPDRAGKSRTACEVARAGLGERFVGHLNGPELAVLLDGRTVLTTVRPEAWEELLHGSGDVGERGRRLAAAARTIALPAAASASEADRARELLPDIDIGAGDGLAVALSGSREASPVGPDGPAPAADRREREPWRDGALMLGVGATAATALVLALVVNAGGWAKRAPPGARRGAFGRGMG